MTDNLQLYSLATPNGQKVSIALEEMGLAYDAHRIDISKGEQFSEAFSALTLNSKIPVLVDPTGDNGKPLPIMESGAILVYLAEKSGQFLPEDPAKKSQTLQWLFWQMAGLGPMLGQLGHFTIYVTDERDLSYPIERYTKEAKRLLSVLEKQLTDKKYIIGDDLTIADFAIFPWVSGVMSRPKAKEMLGFDSYTNITRWVESLHKRPAVVKGMTVCSASNADSKEGKLKSLFSKLFRS